MKRPINKKNMFKANTILKIFGLTQEGWGIRVHDN
jgi:hypothetical protein